MLVYILKDVWGYRLPSRRGGASLWAHRCSCGISSTLRSGLGLPPSSPFLGLCPFLLSFFLWIIVLVSTSPPFLSMSMLFSTYTLSLHCLYLCLTLLIVPHSAIAHPSFSPSHIFPRPIISFLFHDPLLLSISLFPLFYTFFLPIT